jgi:hypothetical protein
MMSLRRAAHLARLGLNSKHLARVNNFDCADHGRDERNEILKGVAGAAEHDDSDLPFGKILLELKISISCHEDSEADSFGCIEQLAILQPSPRLLVDGSDLVPSQKRRKLPRELLIEQNAHARLPLHGPLPRQPQPALSTPSETRRGIRRGCDCVRDSRSGS